MEEMRSRARRRPFALPWPPFAPGRLSATPAAFRVSPSRLSASLPSALPRPQLPFCAPGRQKMRK